MEWRPEDEALIRDFLDSPEKEAVWKWIELQKGKLNGSALSERETHYIDRLEELDNLMRSFEAMILPPPDEEQVSKPTTLADFIP